MEPYATIQEMLQDLAGAVELTPKGGLKVIDARIITGQTLDMLVWTSVFAEDEAVRDAARWIIHCSALAIGVAPASIQGLYDVMGRGEVTGFTVPAFNIRGGTYDITRALFRAAKETNAGFFIIEIAKSEIEYTFQRPAEFAPCVMAAAMREGWTGPIFIQGDHFQFNPKKYAENPEAETEAIKSLAKEAIDAGFYNIDIDSSTLVDLSKPTVPEQQRENFARCAEVTAFIRNNTPAGITVSVGGEIGEVGGKNSTVEEFEAFMEGYRVELDKLFPKVKGISKISIQTGTEHGGVPQPDGTIADAAVDWAALRDIGKVAREKYAISGTVQHGASTLPERLFNEFPRHNCSEIHLATQYQNMFFDHPSFPRELREELHKWTAENCQPDFKEKYNVDQNVYKVRKKSWGAFKKRIWEIPDRNLNPALASLEQKFATMMKLLNVTNTAPLVDEYIRPATQRPPIPEGLKQALAPAAG